MEQYISKSALIAEIEKIRCKVDDCSSYCNGWQHALRTFEIGINTLEVKEFKDEPKFKIEKDKYYVCIRDLFDQYDDKVFIKDEIYLSTKDGYLIPSNSNAYYQVFCPDTYFKPWTIQDAKDGDILAWSDSNCIAIFSKIENDESFISHGFIGNITGVFEKGYGGHSITDHLHPATQEQRDLLFQKMKEAGYQWDEKNKVLRKIEQSPAAYFYCKRVGTIPKCGDCVRNHLNSKYKIEDIKTWMTPVSRSTKQCSDYIPKDSVKWSEEDEQNLNVCLSYIPDESLRRWLTDIIHIKYLNKSLLGVNPTWSDGDAVEE